MKRHIRVSDVGYYILVAPADDFVRYNVHLFNECGKWQSSCICANRAAAMKHRRYMLRLHKKIAAERRCRRRSGND